MIDKIKNKLKWAFTTKLGWAVIAIIWVILFGIIYNITDAIWAYNIAGIGAIAISAFVVILILFGWLINPIKGLINKIKNKNNGS